MVFCASYSVPVLLFLGYLTSYHIWLKIVNKSTYQHILELRKAKREKEEQAQKQTKTKNDVSDINKKFNENYSQNSSLQEVGENESHLTS